MNKDEVTLQKMEAHEAAESPYVTELKEEIHKLDSDEYTHARRLLNEEIKRVESGDKYKTIALVELHHDRPVSNAIKVRIPIKEFPKVNFSGKLLGPKGSTMKQLQQETGCKMSILGRGSMRDKEKEEELRKEGGKYAHLNDDLHLLIECFAETIDGYHRIARALGEVKNFMNPEADPQHMNQMMGQPMEEGMFFNGNAMGRGGPAPRGAPPGRGGPGLMNAPGAGRGGMPPPGRGGVRGAPMPRGGPPSRGAPAQRGAPPAGRGAMPGAPNRGMPPSRGAPMNRGAPAPRGAAPSPRGRGMATQSLPSRSQAVQQEYDDYGAGAAYEADQAYPQDTYGDDQFSRRDPYSEDMSFAEPAAGGGDAQFFDYGHGASTTYDDYDGGRTATRAPSQNFERPGMKSSSVAGPTRPSRGGSSFRPHPYETGSRPGAPVQSRYAAGTY